MPDYYCYWFPYFQIVLHLEQKDKITERNEAIVFAPTITIKSSPAESGTDLFVLHEGTKVKLLDKVGDWSEILLADGNRGWIPTNQIEII